MRSQRVQKLRNSIISRVEDICISHTPKRGRGSSRLLFAVRGSRSLRGCFADDPNREKKSAPMRNFRNPNTHFFFLHCHETPQIKNSETTGVFFTTEVKFPVN